MAMLPRGLKPGGTVGIAATARAVSTEELQPAIHLLQASGFQVKLASNIGLRHHQFAGNDLERAAGLQGLINDSSVDAIWCARGGYGTVRILRHLNLKPLLEQPRWVCGYSDVTALHAALNRLGLPTLHSDMAWQAADKPEATNAFLNVITSASLEEAHSHTALVCNGHLFPPGTKVIGGNMSVLFSLLGSNDLPSAQGKWVFLEDLDEYLYHIDRMAQGLLRSSLFYRSKGILLGAMTDMKDNPTPFGQDANSIIQNMALEAGLPLIKPVSAGHIPLNYPIILGL